MKKFTLLLLVFLSLNLMAETNNKVSISGVVIDAKTKEALPGASISYSASKGTSSDINGKFNLVLSTGSKVLQLEFNFIGYEKKILKLDLTGSNIDLGAIELSENSISLDQVVVKANASIAKQNGSRVSFNAAAVKVHSEAKGMNIIKKLPGFNVSENKLETQGEQIQKVYINGKPYFEDDAKSALNSLPAEIIQNIEVFDDYGDVAEFTGYASGNSVKALNIVTKKEYENARVRKITAGLGSDGKYMLEGNSIFTSKKTDFSISTERNNINRSNSDMTAFKSYESLLSNKLFGASDDTPSNFGEKEFRSFGLNLNHKLNEKLEVSFNYSGGRIDTDLFQESTENVQDIWLYNNIDTSFNESKLHKINTKISFQPNAKNKFILSEKFMFNSSSDKQNSISQAFIDTIPVHQYTPQLDRNSKQVFTNTSAIWLHNFDKEGRSFTALANLKIQNTEGDQQQEGELYNYFFNTEHKLDTNLNAFDWIENTNNKDNSTQIRLSYKEPVLFMSSLNFVLKSGYSWRENDYENFDFNTSTQSYDLYNKDISNTFNSNLYTNRAEIGFSSFSLKSIFNIGLAYEVNSIQNESLNYALANQSEVTHKVLPLMYGKFFLSIDDNFLFFIRSKNTTPSLGQYSPRVDFTNPTQVFAGNPNLEMGTLHMAMFRYTHTLSEKSQFLAIYSFFKYSQNGVALESSFLKEQTEVNGVDLSPGTKLTSYTNMDGFFNNMTGIDYSIPLRFIRSNLNMGASFSYNRIPTRFEDTDLFTFQYQPGMKLGVVSNISERVDFSFQYRGSYSHSSNNETDSYNEFIDHWFVADFNWEMYKGFLFGMEYSYKGIDYLGSYDNQEYHLMNLKLEKSFLKSKKARFGINVQDVFNQNKGIAFYQHETYSENVKSNALGRYFMFSLSYKF